MLYAAHGQGAPGEGEVEAAAPAVPVTLTFSYDKTYSYFTRLPRPCPDPASASASASAPPALLVLVRLFSDIEGKCWVVDSQFARIRKLNGFARIRPRYARLLDIVRIALPLTASPAARIRNSH